MVHVTRLLSATAMAAMLSLPLAARAATITVTETIDSFDKEGCSLREAIQSINQQSDFAECVASGAYGTDDTINLTAVQPYVLSIDGPNEDGNQSGDLDISRSVVIVGLGSTQTTITASGFSSGETDRVFHVTSLPSGGPPLIEVAFQGMTIRDGDATPSGDGGGILVTIPNVNMTLTDVLVTENLSEEDGGGISFYADGGQLTLVNSSVSGNTSPDDGGGIDADGLVVMLDSTIDGNDCQDSGGGIRNSGGLLAVNSTISRNQAVFTGQAEGSGGSGGGIFSFAPFALINTTVSGNEAGVAGGGILSLDPNSTGSSELDNIVALLFNVTIANNSVIDGPGGGICYNCGQIFKGIGPEFRVANTLIAGNTATDSPDCGSADPFVSSGFNMIGDATNCNGFTATGDQIDVADVGIGPLQNNGGPTETHALLTGSPAIDMANNVEGCQAPVIEDLINGTLTLQTLTEDQRGLTRPVAVLDPNVAICDIGAYEFQVEEPTPTPTPVPPVGPSLIEGSGCSLNPANAGSGAAGMGFLLAMAALAAAWRGFKAQRQ